VELLDDVAVPVGLDDVVHFEKVGDEVLLEFSWVVYSLELKYAGRGADESFQTL